MIQVIKTKPTSPGRRGLVKVVNSELYKGRPWDALVKIKKGTGGRNAHGRITVWQRGGAHKRFCRLIDWLRNKDNIKAKVERLEYDPNRSANIALLLYKDGERRYMVAPKGLKVGDSVQSGVEAEAEVGCCLPLKNIPAGTTIHCVELLPGNGAQLARSAGSSIQLFAKEGLHATLRLKSGEVRRVLAECRATIGEVGNSEHNLRKFGKAGAKRWLGIRPHVRGVAMNPVDHPLGGGEGKTSGGRPSCSPWGLPKGRKTRSNKRTDGMIIRGRKSTKGK